MISTRKFLYRLAMQVKGHQPRKALWTGTWNSGSIIVPDISKYNTLEVSFQGIGTRAICFVTGSGTSGYVRGANSFCTATSVSDYVVGLGLDLTTDTLTWVNCVERTMSITNKTVSTISGVTISGIWGIE